MMGRASPKYPIMIVHICKDDEPLTAGHVRIIAQLKALQKLMSPDKPWYTTTIPIQSHSHNIVVFRYLS
jgi:hypothetical protein